KGRNRPADLRARIAVGAASGRAGGRALGRRPPRRQRRVSEEEHGRLALLEPRAHRKCPGSQAAPGAFVWAPAEARGAPSGAVIVVDNSIDKELDTAHWNLYPMSRVRLSVGRGVDRAPARGPVEARGAV